MSFGLCKSDEPAQSQTAKQEHKLSKTEGTTPVCINISQGQTDLSVKPDNVKIKGLQANVSIPKVRTVPACQIVEHALLLWIILKLDYWLMLCVHVCYAAVLVSTTITLAWVQTFETNRSSGLALWHEFVISQLKYQRLANQCCIVLSSCAP